MNFRGVNLGGWLMMEGYIIAGRNIPEKAFRKAFREAQGGDALHEFDHEFRSRFITASDFKRIRSWGANSVRLPFHYRLIESRPFEYDMDGLKWLKKALSWGKKYQLKIILDLHAAPGC